MPGTIDVGGDALPVQLAADLLEAAELGEADEDAPNDLGLERLDCALAGRAVIAVAEAALTEALRDTPGPGPLKLAARRPLDDLLALDLGGEGAQAHHQLPERRVLDLLSHTLQ